MTEPAATPAPGPRSSTGAGLPSGTGATDDSPRGRLLRAARQVVTDQGLEGLTLRAIARQAGVSHGAPLRHFPSLAALLAALAAEGFVGLIAAVDTAVAATDAAAAATGRRASPHDRLASAGHAYVHHAVSDPGVFTVMFRQERVDVTDPDYRDQGFAAFRQLADLVADVQRTGWRPDVDTTDLAAVLWANVHGLAELAIHGALAGVGGPDAVERVTALSTELSLGLDPAAPAARAPRDPQCRPSDPRPRPDLDQNPGDQT